MTENIDLNSDERGIQPTPVTENVALITQLNNREHTFLIKPKKETIQTENTPKSMPYVQQNLQETKFQVLGIKILIFRLINILRRKSGNVAIDSVKPCFLNLLNDLGSETTEYQYKGLTINRLISLQKKQNRSHLVYIWLIQKLSKLPIISPNTKVSLLCDIIILITTSLQLILVPLIMTFELSGNFIIESQPYIYSILSIDMFRQILTGIYINGNLVMEGPIIFRNYLKKDIWLDIITILTFWISMESLVIRILFLLRFQKIAQMLNKMELTLNQTNLTLMTLMKSIFLLLFVTHLMSCFMNQIQYSTGTNWKSQNLYDHSIVGLYIQSMYWAVVTMVSVGYGDVVPTTIWQKIYSACCMFLGCCLFGYMMNSIGNMLNSMNENTKNHSKYRKMHEEYYHKKPISSDVQNRINMYAEHYYQFQKSSINSGQEILKIVPQELKNEFEEQVNGRIVMNNKFLTLFTLKLQKLVINQLSERVYLPSDFITKETMDLYILNSGIVHQMDEKLLIQKYDRPFTNMNIYSFITGICIKGSLYSQDYTSIFILCKSSFANLLDTQQLDFEKFHRLKDDLLFNKNFQEINLICSVCCGSDHLIQNCSKLHFIPNKQRILQSLSQNQQKRFYQYRLGRKSNTYVHLEYTQAAALLYVEDNITWLHSHNLHSISFTYQGSEKRMTFLNLSPKSNNRFENSPASYNSLIQQQPSLMLTENSNATQLNTNTIAIELHNLDMVCTFTEYFPKFNIANIAQQINSKIKRSIRARDYSMRKSLYLTQAIQLRKFDTIDFQNQRESIKQRQFKRTSQNQIDVVTPQYECHQQSVIMDSTQNN